MKNNVKGINNKAISNLITNFLLIKNLPTHYKFVRENKKGKLLGKKVKFSPYLNLIDLMENNPEIKNKVAIKQDREVTYLEFRKEIDKLGQFLHYEIGALKGENITICAESSIEGIESFFAFNKLGLVNARAFNGAKKDKLNHSIIDFDSRIVFTDDSNLDELSISLDGTRVENIIIMSETTEEKINNFKQKNPNVNIYLWSEIISKEYPYDDYIEEVGINDMASILYTSGSSGEPKPISITNKVYVNMPNIVETTANQKICDDEKVIGVVSHEYPYAAINSTVMILLMGKTLILPKTSENNTLDFHDLIKNHPDKIQAIPNFYKLLENAISKGEVDTNDLKNLKSIVSGGETYLLEEKIDIINFLNKFLTDPLLIDGFGFGELGSATALKFGLSDYFLLMNGIVAKTIDEKTGEDLKTGKEGILCISSPSISKCYYNNEEATKDSYITDKNGNYWFKSDTYGSVHGMFNRLVKLGGRIREYFITGDGHGNFVKVYAGNVENSIMATNIVENCIVVPSDSSALPTAVAYISIKDDCFLTPDEIENKVKESCKTLEEFAQPTEIIIEKEIKRTDAQKKDYKYYRQLQLAKDKIKTLC